MKAPASGPAVTLAIDTTGREGTLYLARGADGAGIARLNAAGRRNARTLVSEAVTLCERHGLRLADVKLVCVALGPGSFTGLRTGVTFAKTLAFATGCDIIGVPSHLAVRRIVWRSEPAGTRLRVVSDALRGDLYLTRVTLREPGEPPAAEGPRLVPGGPNLEPQAKRLSETRAGFEVGAVGSDDVILYGRGPGGTADAGTVFAAGLEMWRAGLRDDPFALVPLYVRRSSAEETADSRDRAAGRMRPA